MEPNYSLVMIVLLLSINTVLITASSNSYSMGFLSPGFEVEPGSVVSQFFYDIDFPRGHIGVKSFTAEILDESGNSVPLSELYIHHWNVRPYQTLPTRETTGHSFTRFSGECMGIEPGHYFGPGSDSFQVPDPYAIELGASEDERWSMTVHAIDTRGVEDRLGCNECRCELYNVTRDGFGRALRPGYKGGLDCCYNQTRCRLGEQGFVNGGDGNAKRRLYMMYRVEWVEWSDSLLPVKMFIMDITDDNYVEPVVNGTRSHKCQVEYDIAQSCDIGEPCVNTKTTNVTVPKGGYVIYAVAHQHTGGVGAILYGEDWRILCESGATYGEEEDAGYLITMAPGCYPEPGSMEILDGETLVIVSHYDSMQAHTGVMTLFYVVVADRLPNSTALPN